MKKSCTIFSLSKYLLLSLNSSLEIELYMVMNIVKIITLVVVFLAKVNFSLSAEM